MSLDQPGTTGEADLRAAGQLSARFRAGMRPLAIGTGLCVALAAPTVDFLLERHDLALHANSEAQEIASHVGRMEHTSGLLNRHDLAGVQREIDDALKDHPLVEVTRVELLDLTSQPLIAPPPQSSLFPIRGVAPLTIGGVGAGLLLITVGQRELIDRDLMLLGVFGSLGLVLAAALYFFPLRLFREDDLVRLFAWRSIKAAEEERLRLSRDLHDGIGQSLGAAAVAVARLDSRAGGTPESAECGRLIDGALEELRRVSRGLRPPSLDDLGLGAAVEGLAREAAGAGFEVKVEIQQLPRLNSETEQTCFRLAQEALANVARHARAANVRVALGCELSNLVLEVQDDGCGFSPEGGMGLGLVGARERAARLSGVLSVKSSRGHGTRFKAMLPLVQP